MAAAAPHGRYRILKCFQLGVPWGVFGFTVALTVAQLAVVLVPQHLWGGSAAAAVIQRWRDHPGVLLFLIVVYAPLWETLIGNLLPLEILRRCRVGPAISVLLAALLFGWGHYRNGGLLHGIVTVAAGALLSYVYLRYRSEGIGMAYGTTAVMHASNNALAVIGAMLGGDRLG